jgi:HEAT repeat protein
MTEKAVECPIASIHQLADLVSQANIFKEQALRDLEAFLGKMEKESDTALWPERLHILGGLEHSGLRDRSARILAGRAQEDQRMREYLIQIASSTNTGERGLGLLSLGYVSFPEVSEIDLLRSGLEAADDSVWNAASVSLGKLGSSHKNAAEELYRAAEKGLYDRSLPGLALLCDTQERAVTVFQEATSSPSREIHQIAAKALMEADPIPCSSLPILEKLLHSTWANVQVTALRGITRACTRFPEAVAKLRSYGQDPASPIRLRALRCLGEAAEIPEARQTVLDILQRADTDSLIAVTMGFSISARKDLDGCLPILAELARNEDPDVLTTLAQVLAEVASSRPGGPVEVLDGLLGAGIPTSIFPYLAQIEGEIGLLAVALMQLWSGEGEPVASLAHARETLTQMGESAKHIEEIYRLLENLTHFATVDEILASAGNLSPHVPPCNEAPPHLHRVIERLRRWVETLSTFETEQNPETQSKIIQGALTELDTMRSEFESDIFLPEGFLMAHLAARWKSVVLQMLFAARRGAEVALHITDRKVERGGTGAISLAVRNRGPGVAYQIQVELRPSKDYSIQLGSYQLPSLSAGESHTLDFTLTPASTNSDRLRVELRATYSDFVEADRSVSYAEEIPFLTGGTFTPIPNPYIPGLPLEVGNDLFMGREDVFKFLEENLMTSHHKRVITLVGQRRMGKTSILKQLPMRLPKDFLSVFVDCQGLEHQGLGNLLYHLAYIIGDVLMGEGIAISIPELASFQERPLFSFEYGFLKPSLSALGMRTLLILIDEFQSLEEAVEANQLDQSIFGFIRSLMQHQEKLCFLFSGLQKHLEESKDYWQPVFNIALQREVGLLEERYARELIEKPVQGTVFYDPAALDELMRLCCGHPYLTQLFCDRLINHLNEIRENRVHLQHIHEVIPSVFAAGVNHFYSLWEDLGQREKIVLIAISKNLTQHRFATLSAITRTIREKGIHADLEEVTTVLQTLLSRDLITFVNAQPPGYALRILIFRLWIEKEMLSVLIGGKIKWQ